MMMQRPEKRLGSQNTAADDKGIYLWVANSFGNPNVRLICDDHLVTLTRPGHVCLLKCQVQSQATHVVIH